VEVKMMPIAGVHPSDFVSDSIFPPHLDLRRIP
jgi:hypothetical protein